MIIFDNKEVPYCYRAERTVDRSTVLTNVIKRCLCSGNIDGAARALLQLRQLIGDRACIYNQLYPYLPIIGDISEDLANARLAAVVAAADAMS